MPRFEFVDGVFGIMVRCTGCQCMVYGPGQDAHVCPAGLVVAVPCPPQPVELPEAV